MRRRTLLGLIAVLGAALRAPLALAQWRADAFGAETLADAMAALFGGRAPEPSAAVTMDVEAKIENGAVVPIQITAQMDGVRTVNIFAELNPNPLLARFHLSPRCRPVLATRVKVGAPSDVIVVVETQDRLLEARRFVEVVEGGCG